MTERLLRIRMRAIGQETVVRAVRGITQSAAQAARSQERSARDAARAQQAAERSTTREAQQSARARERAAQEEQRQRQRAMSQTARAAVQMDREIARSNAATARAEQQNSNEVFRTRMRLRAQEQRAARQAAREQERTSRSRWQMAGMIGGAALGAGRALYGRVQGYQAALGMPGRDDLVTSYLDRQRSTIRLAHQAGISTSDLNTRVDETARRSGVSQSDLVGGLSYAQETLASPDFNALDVFSRHLDQIADASYATGAPIQDLIGALGQMHSQFGITEDQFGEMIGAMVQMAANGSIEVGDLAANFTAEMAQFRQLRGGATGVEAAREFAGTAEAIGRQTPGSPEQASTAFRGVMTALGTSRVRSGIESGLRRGGLSRAESDVFDDRTGAMTISMPELINRMRRGHLDSSAAFGSAGIRNVRAQAGFRALLDTSPETYQEILNSSSEQGNATIRDTNAELRGSDAGRVDIARATAEANFQQNGHATVDTMVELATATTELQTRFPQLTEAMGALSDVVGGMGLGGIVGGIGARVAAGGSVAGALGLGGSGAAAAGGGAGLLARAGGLLMGGGGLGLAAGLVAQNFIDPSHAGGTSDVEQAPRSAARGHLDAAARDVLIQQRQALGDTGGAELSRQVQSRAASGQDLSPATIRALADAIARGVAGAIPSPSAPSSLGTSAGDRRIAADRR